jgi:hypothetical protein
VKGTALAALVYLALFVPFGIFFTSDEGLPQPYFTILGTGILAGSWAVGRFVGAFWAVLLPVVPWSTAILLISITPEEDLGEVTRQGSMILWSFVFLLLTGLVFAGILSARRLSVFRGRIRPR